MLTTDQWIRRNFPCPNCESMNQERHAEEDRFGRYKYHCPDCGMTYEYVLGIVRYEVIDEPKNDTAHQAKELEQSTCEGLLN